MANQSSAAMFARAEEALLHAAITGDPDIRAKADLWAAKAAEKSAKQMSPAAKELLRLRFLEQDAAAGDPVAAAMVGALSFSALVRQFESGQVDRFLTTEELAFLAGRPAYALRYVLRARRDGDDINDEAFTTLPTTQQGFALAARGRLSKSDLAVVTRLLHEADASS